MTYSDYLGKSSLSTAQSIQEFFMELWLLLKEGAKTYMRKRIGYRRSFIFLSVLALIITHTASIETRIGIFLYFSDYFWQSSFL